MTPQRASYLLQVPTDNGVKALRITHFMFILFTQLQGFFCVQYCWDFKTTGNRMQLAYQRKSASSLTIRSPEILWANKAPGVLFGVPQTGTKLRFIAMQYAHLKTDYFSFSAIWLVTYPRNLIIWKKLTLSVEILSDLLIYHFGKHVRLKLNNLDYFTGKT